MHHHSIPKAAFLAMLLSVASGPLAYAQTDQTAPAGTLVTNTTGKPILLPPRIDRIPAGNDFNNPDSQFSFKHSKTTDNFILLWDKEFGDDPMANPVANRRFDVDAILKESDRFYNYYLNTMKWVGADTNKSYASKYKFIFVVFGGNSGTAFGGSVNIGSGRGAIGAFWTPVSRIIRGPYGVVAHELGHSFQALDRADGANSFSGGSIAEMTSQWMLFQVYPDWMVFENYHLTAFMKATHLAFLHEDNQYHSAYPLEYWSEKHGVEIIGKMWREVQRGEDPVMTYKRLTGINQNQFNDEMFDADRRFVTWDMPRIKEVAAPYANQHTSSIAKSSEEGWYQISSNVCPQNYGYNAIKLKVPAADTKVSIDFKGLLDDTGYHVVHPDRAGWRYGFVAYKNDGTRVYSDAFSKAPGTGEFAVPADTKFLWLVVSGAPTEHWIHVGSRGGGGGGGGRGRGARAGGTNTVAMNTNSLAINTNSAVTTSGGSTNADTLAGRRGRGGNNNSADANEQWPYAFKLTGTTPDESMVHAGSVTSRSFQ